MLLALFLGEAMEPARNLMEGLANLIRSAAWPIVAIVFLCHTKDGLKRILDASADHVGRLKRATLPGGIVVAFELLKPLDVKDVPEAKD